MAPERIGVLGSGDVGRALGEGFARHGWDVLVGASRDTTMHAFAVVE